MANAAVSVVATERMFRKPVMITLQLSLIPADKSALTGVTPIRLKPHSAWGNQEPAATPTLATNVENSFGSKPII